ncbi:EexN family lipoprotein [Actinobacillus porcinus]|uniref:EexN family lipoprotein n=1 Tax=Actinobacillus porcinus TaxID=51048 RepID=UPI002A9171E0|nr:EexN family lipoprotein [Actinobacillus porcinus]MDY6216593.1 EexN family lipoprotein [Actinobacillus porcinus]
MKKVILLSLMSIFLSACSEEVITIEQFKADQSLLDSYLSKCKNGELHEEDINCINARKAKTKIILEAERRAIRGE